MKQILFCLLALSGAAAQAGVTLSKHVVCESKSVSVKLSFSSSGNNDSVLSAFALQVNGPLKYPGVVDPSTKKAIYAASVARYIGGARILGYPVEFVVYDNTDELARIRVKTENFITNAKVTGFIQLSQEGLGEAATCMAEDAPYVYGSNPLTLRP